MPNSENKYGTELILDLYQCDVSKFTEQTLRVFFIELCKEIDMERYGEPMFWIDNSDTPHLKGVSAVQFITTSNVTIHCLDKLQTVFINLFSCKPYDTKQAKTFCENYFQAADSRESVIGRYYNS
ncbi:MAG: S-adenosylmethionine decarboxylase [Candidatus Saccharibacteria bacterium]|nr:S-adenosylmethionine decarboxylase [Candidatus Saccharibacteria bacterium]